MSFLKRMRQLSLLLLSFACILFAVWPTAISAAGPTNLGRTRIVVTDFNADNTGNSDARDGIQKAINSCTATAGCEIYFPPGVYALYTPPPMATSVITVPSNVPITLAGVNGYGSTLEAMQYMGNSANYDIIGVGTGSVGFTAHDLSIPVLPATSAAGAIAGAIFHLPGARNSSFYNIFVNGGFDIFELGNVTSTSVVNDGTYIRSINSENGNDCFLRLDGGVSHTFVRGVYAQANETPGSQILCMPSSQTGAAFPGVSEVHVVDSSFEGFVRGFSITSAQFNFTGLYLDDLFIDNDDDGPSLEFFKSPDSAATVSNINVANTTVVSSSTACVVHGGVSGVSLTNDTCGGGATSKLPLPCPTISSERGFALIDVSGTPTVPGSVTLTVQTSSSSSTPLVVPFGTTDTAASIASNLGAAINSSSLVGSTTACPVLVKVQVFSDYDTVHGVVAHSSIGSEVEVYTYYWGNSYPTISIVSSGGGIMASVPNVAATFCRLTPAMQGPRWVRPQPT
jgi:hypothetical protein